MKIRALFSFSLLYHRNCLLKSDTKETSLNATLMSKKLTVDRKNKNPERITKFFPDFSVNKHIILVIFL